MKNLKKINLISLANNEIKKQELVNIKGGMVQAVDKNMCACRNWDNYNRSQVPRRNYFGVPK